MARAGVRGNPARSAAGNQGEQAGEGLKFSAAPSSTPAPAETRAQAAQRKIQDKFNRFKVIQDWLKARGINLSEQADVYQAETTMHGRISSRKQDFRELRVAP